MELFTHNIKKFKSAAHKNGDVDDTCKRTLITACQWSCGQVAYLSVILSGVGGGAKEAAPCNHYPWCIGPDLATPPFDMGPRGPHCTFWPSQPVVCLIRVEDDHFWEGQKIGLGSRHLLNFLFFYFLSSHCVICGDPPPPRVVCRYNFFSDYRWENATWPHKMTK